MSFFWAFEHFCYLVDVFSFSTIEVWKSFTYNEYWTPTGRKYLFCNSISDTVCKNVIESQLGTWMQYFHFFSFTFWWSVFHCLWNKDDTLLVLQRIMVTAWMIMFFFFPKTFGTLWMLKESKILFQQTFKKNEYWKCSSATIHSLTLISSWLPLLRKHRYWIHFAGSFCNAFCNATFKNLFCFHYHQEIELLL